VTTFVLATANSHKAEEMRAVLSALDIQLVARPADVPDVDETEDTLEGNATLKARALVEATGCAAIADDTGLFVEALDGRPGVHSARYAGEYASYEDNVAASRRGAQFRTVIVVAYPDRESSMIMGTLDGSITLIPRGEEGFGYDSVFEPADMGGRTLAEMTPEDKNAISHRGNALRALAYMLAKR
jgi:XTP/dITP diphosphohydrolase